MRGDLGRMNGGGREGRRRGHRSAATTIGVLNEKSKQMEEKKERKEAKRERITTERRKIATTVK